MTTPSRLLITLIAITLSICDVAMAVVITGTVVAGNTTNPTNPSFARSSGLQTNTVELDNFMALSGSGQYATDLASLIGSGHAGRGQDEWDTYHTIVAGDWDGIGGKCEPVGLTTSSDVYKITHMATDIFAMALAGYLDSDDTMFASVKQRLVELQTITDFEHVDLSGSNQCILDMGTAAYHLTEAAWLMEDAGYSEWSATDRQDLAAWLVQEVFPLVDYAISDRKSNWGIIGLGSALAISAYANGGITTMYAWDGTPVTPAAYLSGYMTKLNTWMSDGVGDELDSDCAAATPPRAFGFQASGAFPDDLRRPYDINDIDIPDCEATSIATHSTDGGCVSSISCNLTEGHFYSNKTTNGLVRVAEIMRRLGDNSVFDMDTHAGGDLDIIAAAKFNTGGNYQTYLIPDTTQGYRHVAGEYYGDSALLDALQSGVSVSVRGGRDYAYTRITHAPGVSYDLPNLPFVTLDESTTFGPGGSVFDLSTRVVAPNYIGAPPAYNDAIYTSTLDLSAETCGATQTCTDLYSNAATPQTTGSPDGNCDFNRTVTVISTLESVLQDDIEEFINCTDSYSGANTPQGGAGADGLCDSDRTSQAGKKNARILLPTSCAVDWYVTAGASGVEFTIPNDSDDLQFYCPDGNAVCGFNQVMRPGVGVFSNGDYLTGSSTGEFGISSFYVGSSKRTGVTNCNITPTNEYGARVYQLDCALSTSGASAWGPGDIVRIQSNPIPGQGTDGYNYLTRITCVENSSGARSPASDPTGELCGLLGAAGTNRVQVENAPPFNLHPDANWWGSNVDVAFTNCVNFGDCGGTTFTDYYEATAGQKMVQIERMGSLRCGIVAGGVCGNGTASAGAQEEIAENVWFVNVNWTSDLKVGGAIARWLNAFGGGHYGGRVSASGRPSLITFGGTGSEAGSVSMHSTIWDGFWAENAKGSGRILQINKTNPVSIHVAGTSAHTVWSASNDGGSRIHITDGVVDPDLKDKTFISEASTFVAGSPGYWVVELQGFNDSTFDVDTGVGTGWVSKFDQYAGSTYYLNGFASNIQIINNVFINPSQHAISQGCTGCVYAANYVRNPIDESPIGRGPFHHGNAGSPGNIYEMNDQDTSIVTHDSSNRAPDDAGEGSNLIFYKNRNPYRAATTWPPGTNAEGDYGHGATVGVQNAPDQRGAANQYWTIVGNSGYDTVLNGSGQSGLTGCDNTDTGPSYTCLAPHQTIDAAIFHNKCGSCNLDNYIDGVDNNADGVPDTRNTTTRTDILLNEFGENVLGLEGNWSSYIGQEPTSIFFDAVPDFWCQEAMTFGEMGAYYDDFNTTLGKLPAQILYESGSAGCTPL